jgi:GT2 family glycosyltransferase
MDSSYENFFVVVADNCSTDDSIPFLHKAYPGLQLILLDKNYGFAEGYNRALSQLEADYFVLLNSDVEVTKGWLEPLVKLMDLDKSIAACQPKIRSYRNKTLFEYAGASGGWIDKLGYPFCRGRIMNYCERDNGQYDDISEIFWASGACFVIRPSIFREMEGFDPFFFAHQEEIDLCWRIKNAGFTIYVQPGSVVYHLGGGSLEMGNKRKVFLNFRNNLILMYKNLPGKTRKKVLFFRMLLDGLAALQFLLKGRGGSFCSVVKAHVGFYRWRSSKKYDSIGPEKNDLKLTGFYNGSIVFEYFIKRKRTFSQIVENKK